MVSCAFDARPILLCDVCLYNVCVVVVCILIRECNQIRINDFGVNRCSQFKRTVDVHLLINRSRSSLSSVEFCGEQITDKGIRCENYFRETEVTSRKCVCLR